MAENNLNARLRALPKIDEVLHHTARPNAAVAP